MALQPGNGSSKQECLDLITVETEAQKGETILRTLCHDFGGHGVSDSPSERPGGDMFKPPGDTRYEQGPVGAPLFTVTMALLVLGPWRPRFFMSIFRPDTSCHAEGSLAK